MKNMKTLKGQKYLLTILATMLVFLVGSAIYPSNADEVEEDVKEMRDEIVLLKKEICELKESNNVYITQNDVNVFEGPSSLSKKKGVFKAGAVIKANSITEDGIWAVTNYGYVKLVFIRGLEEAKTNVMFEEVKEEVKKDYSAGVVGKSGLTKKDLSILLKGSKMENCIDAILKIENDYNVNAFFTISVAQAETQRGSTGIGASKNNAYGITQRSGGYRTFNTLSDSVLEFGGMLDRVYISKGRNTVSKVGQIYCGTPVEWEIKVNRIMSSELAKMKTN